MPEHAIRVEHRFYADAEEETLEDGMLSMATLTTTPTRTVEVEATADDLLASWLAVLDSIPPTLRAALEEALRT